MVKKIASIKVVEAGSPPDIDSDFHTAYRDEVLAHCEDLYGRGTLANIVTFSTLAAKGAFKTMCTIYNVPFAQANKIASLVPGPIEGVDCTIEDIFNPNSDRYEEAADFRNAVAGDTWTHIIEGAKAIEGRVRATGVHPCGIVISSKPLIETIPLQVRQSDGRVITQWTYKELESLGLIKFDFLGLDTVDLIAHTVEYIKKSGKTPPNMVDIIHGPMNDKKTFAMLGRGETDGVFQLASPGVKDLLRRMKPTELDDIVATTALYRPGPMGMKSHIKYADRKNAREKVDYPVHKDFKGTELETILEKTQNLVVYQEQVMQIANRIGGMTLQEGDKLRKAMGKKDKVIMAKMKPLFLEGGKLKGFSEDSLQELWATMEVFAEYGFNKSHSVAYAINAYQSAFLKANYPVEFMAALISQNIGRKEKILAFLQEAKRMGLKVGTADINISDVKVAPDYSGKSSYDIVYGLAGINAVSEEMARIIVEEREASGEFSSVQDLINRCLPKGVANKKIYENLALSGAFDRFEDTRKDIVEALPLMLTEGKTKSAKGASLFDMLGGAEEPIAVEKSGEEYSHLEKLTKEAEVIGLYLTSHPLANAGKLASLRTASIGQIMKSGQMAKHRVVGSLTEINVKRQRRGGKSIAITIDDGTGFITAFLHKDIVKGLDKRVAQEKIMTLYKNGATELSSEIEELAFSEFKAVEELEIGQVYSMELNYRPGFDDNPYSARIQSLTKLNLAHDGSMPVRMRLHKPTNSKEKQDQVAFIKKLQKDFPGTSPIFVSYWEDSVSAAVDDVYHDAVDFIRASETVDDITRTVEETTITGTVEKTETIKSDLTRNWPPPKQERKGIFAPNAAITVTAEAIEEMNYRPTRFFMEKSGASARVIEDKLGIENYDFGVFDAKLLDD